MALRLGTLTPSKLYYGASEITRAYLGAIEVYSSGGAPALWTPADLGAALALWLDAADPSTITLNGSTVSQWRDKSENGRHFTQATGANQPTYSASGLNGGPALTFNGSSTFMSAGDTLDARTSNITIMAVARYATSNQPGVLIGKTRFSATTGRYFLMRAPTPIAPFVTGTQYATMNSQGSAGAAAQSLDDSTDAGLFGGEWNRAVSTGYTRVWRNGIATATTAYAGDTDDYNTTDQLWIGAYQSSTGAPPPIAGSYLNGQMSEMVVTLSTLSTADRQKLEGYLAWKWGLQANLPVNHPYRWDGTLFGYYKLWTPAEISTALWLDADDASTITLNGSTVSQWRDKSGNGRHANQTVATSQPAYTTAGLNGKNVLTFDGTSDFFELSSGILLNDNFTHVHSVLVRSTTGRHTVDVGRTTTPVGYANWWYSDNVLYSNLRGNNFMTHGGSTATGTFINGLVRNNSGTQAYRNGTAFGGAVGAAVTGNLTLNAIGRAQGSLAAVHNGPMAEVIVGRSDLSTDDRQKLEGYLAWKWGLQANLPSDHPYKNGAPTV